MIIYSQLSHSSAGTDIGFIIWLLTLSADYYLRFKIPVILTGNTVQWKLLSPWQEYLLILCSELLLHM
jgi:hypothetical protein